MHFRLSAALKVRALCDEAKAAINTVTDQLVANIRMNGGDSNIDELAVHISPIFQWLRQNKGLLPHIYIYIYIYIYMYIFMFIF